MSSPFQKSFCGKSPLKPTPLKQMSPGNVGYYDSTFENHPSENLPTRRENLAEEDAGRFSQDRAKTLRKEMRKMPKSQAKADLAQEVYNLHRQESDAKAKTRAQKKQDYSDILQAGKTIAKSSALFQRTTELPSEKPKKKEVKKETNIEVKKQLPQAVKDSLQRKALERGKPFYSKKHKVYVDGEDGVLDRSPKFPNNYEQL